MPQRDVLLSLHDVAPAHRERVVRAEALFAALGVRKITYLLVPAFHSDQTCDADAAFVDWCRRPRPFAVDWLLHGFHHREDRAVDAIPERVGDRLKRRYMTAGEGEFLAMDADEADRRVSQGIDVFRRTLGREPRGFVAPAWLFHPSLGSVLARRGIGFHEDHGGILPTDGAAPIPAPVVTWATRTPIRKRTSILGTPVLAAVWRRKPLLRLAVHPHDFDHDDTVASIRRVWRSVLRRREQRLYGEVLAA
ncbi:MAG: polysaccharide deacetylase [Gemmatimonadetes bacterium]|nr:polysaccharide deacetylase [Gemmatimonadota bacterium]